MSLPRRRMMMQIIESGAKYPLVNGRHEFSDGSYVEISNGNHIMFYKSINGGGYIDISDISQNSDTIDNVQNINYKPKIYTIPAGVQTRLEVKNVKGIGGYDAQTNFRLSERNISGSFKTGNFTYNNPEFNTVVLKTLENPEDVGCLFIFSAMPAGAQVEFDVELTVNGERWI